MSAVGEPLAGCVIVVTADRRKRELAEALQRRGATIGHAPALSTIQHIDDDQLLRDTRAVIEQRPDIVVATTGIGFRGWIEAADAGGLAEPLLDALRGARLMARGPKARGAIQAAGLAADWVAESETSVEMRDYLLAEGVEELVVAVQHHGNGSDGLDEALQEAGATVRSLVVYRWAPPVDPAPHLSWIAETAAGRVDGVVFTSAPAAQVWVDDVVFQGHLEALRDRALRGELLLAAVGPITAGPLQDAGLKVEFPDRWRMGALIRHLVKHYADQPCTLATPYGPLVMRATCAVLDGRTLPLTPTGLELLRGLARAGGNVLTRADLAAMLPGAASAPHAVEAAINRLRDNAGTPGLVRTVVKRGYALSVAS